MQYIANVMDELQTFVLLLHDNIQQNHRDVRFCGKDFSCLLCRIGMQKCQRSILYFNVAEGESRCRMHVCIIVDDHDLPDIVFHP